MNMFPVRKLPYDNEMVWVVGWFGRAQRVFYKAPATDGHIVSKDLHEPVGFFVKEIYRSVDVLNQTQETTDPDANSIPEILRAMNTETKEGVYRHVQVTTRPAADGDRPAESSDAGRAAGGAGAPGSAS